MICCPPTFCAITQRQEKTTFQVSLHSGERGREREREREKRERESLGHHQCHHPIAFSDALPPCQHHCHFANLTVTLPLPPSLCQCHCPFANATIFFQCHDHLAYTITMPLSHCQCHYHLTNVAATSPMPLH